MKLTVNGQLHDVSAATLDELLEELEFKGEWLATAVNARVVHAAERVRCTLAEGDEIEVLSPMQGG